MKTQIIHSDKKSSLPQIFRSSFFLIFIFLFLSLNSCSHRAKLTPAQIELINRVYQEANRFFYRGDYYSLQEAYSRFKDLLNQGYHPSLVGQRLLETSFLLTLREKELAIPHHDYLAQTEPFVTPHLEQTDLFSLWAIIKELPLEIKGFTNEFMGRRIAPEIKQLIEEKALTSSFWAYLYLHFFPYPGQEKNIKTQIEKIFGEAPLIKYKLAIFPQKKSEELKQFLQAHSLFKEIYFFLGHQLLNEGKFSEAEIMLKQAYEFFPNSLNIIIVLSQFHFRLEEFEECLNLNNKAINLKPDFRDALLGKVMCLTYLARHEEAIATALKLLELGYYYLGETHYWLARNFHALDQLDEAWEHIEKAKKYLIGWNEVHSLAGEIALAQNNLSEAENNFKEAMKLDPTDCSSIFSLGKVNSIRQKWKISATYYQQAAECFENQKKVLTQEINEIQSSDLDESRKIRLIQKKKSQFARLHLVQGTAFYNSAAGYFNTGIFQEALKMAELASRYTQLKEKAIELITRIKEEIKNIEKKY